LFFKTRGLGCSLFPTQPLEFAVDILTSRPLLTEVPQRASYLFQLTIPAHFLNGLSHQTRFPCLISPILAFFY